MEALAKTGYERTAGQVAYGTWHAVRFPGDPPPGYDHPATRKARPAWKASAEAVIAFALPHLIVQRDGARREAAGHGAALARIRELAESWAALAPAGRTVAEDFTTSPHDAVSSDCGREILATLGEPERAALAPEANGAGTGEPGAGDESPVPAAPLTEPLEPGRQCDRPDCGSNAEWATVRQAAEGGEAS